MKINLQIDRLVLDGVTVSQRERPLLQAAVESELARLMSAGGLKRELAAGVALPLVNGDEMQLPMGADPARLGGAIARAVYGGVGEGTAD